MCLIALAWRPSPGVELVVVGNRDEFHARPTAPATLRGESPPRIGGLDLRAGGSWLEFAPGGGFAAVTNVRRPPFETDRPRSRGALVSGSIDAGADWGRFAEQQRGLAQDYARFNLLAWDGAALHYASNADGWRQEQLMPGLHTLSNAALDTPWPKALRAGERLADWLQRDANDDQAAALQRLLDAFLDAETAADAALPQTGLRLEQERWLSSMFIAGADYGTRSSTALLQLRDGRWWFIERRFGPQAQPLGTRSWHGVGARVDAGG